MATGSAGNLQLITDDSKWDSLVYSSLESNPFLMSSFLRSIDQADSRIAFIANGEPIIGTCLFAPSELETDLSQAFCLYQGAFFPFLKQSNYSEDNERLRRLKMFIESIDALGEPRRFSFHPQIQDLRGIAWFYYETEVTKLVPDIISRYTGTIEIERFASFENYLTTIRRERLREYRKSLETQQTAVLESDDIENFLKIYVTTFARQGTTVTLNKLDRVNQIISRGLQDRSGRLSMLYSAIGEAISGTYILSDKNLDVYLFGANDTSFRGSYGPTRLLLDSIQETFRKQKSKFDFCGMNSPNRGEFKSSFNARVQPYFELNLEIRKDS